MLVNRIILCRVKFGQRRALYALWLKKDLGRAAVYWCWLRGWKCV